MTLKEQRLAAGLTQMQLAAKIGVTVNSVIKWEQGGGKPSPENLIKLKAVLGE